MHLLNAICPLWVLDDHNRPDFVGSSTLLHFGDAHFLVSCAHVADNIGGRDVVFIAGDTLKQISGQGRISNLQPGQTRKRDRVDSFFIRLSEESVAAMREFYHFVSSEEIAVGQAATTSTNYTFIGYPMKLAQPRGRVLKPEERSLTAAAMTDKDYAALKLSRFTHVGIRLGGGRLVDLADRSTNLPQLNGISGGPVLMHFYESQKGQSVHPRVIGLCMEQPPEYPTVFLGVRLAAVLEAIRERHPDIGPLIPHDPDVTVTIGRPPQ